MGGGEKGREGGREGGRDKEKEWGGKEGGREEWKEGKMSLLIIFIRICTQQVEQCMDPAMCKTIKIRGVSPALPSSLPPSLLSLLALPPSLPPSLPSSLGAFRCYPRGPDFLHLRAMW